VIKGATSRLASRERLTFRTAKMSKIRFFTRLKPHLNGKVLAVKVLPSLIFILAFLIIVQYAKQHSPNRNDAKLKELEQLAIETKVYPDFIEVASSTSSRSVDAGVYKSYRSSADFEAVKEFYLNALGHDGWNLSEEKAQSELLFKKGAFWIVVEHTEASASAPHWNYSVNFVWRSQP
jgi:hypothetical protein